MFGTVFSDLRFSEFETTVDFEAVPAEMIAAAVIGTEDFKAGLLDLAILKEERVGLGEAELRGGKGSSGSGGSGGSGRRLSPVVKRGGDGPEALCGGNQGFAIHCYGAFSLLLNLFLSGRS